MLGQVLHYVHESHNALRRKNKKRKKEGRNAEKGKFGWRQDKKLFDS